ncbi:ABC transporter substrate-binding protein [Zavarzinia sp. CC-PAN008]|uniref:ABC transporter substrate-binding protein n=1 Tax=Zavarzinia sp. CC-PAN008 TaxID=3243332 RepID=UPI003F74864F
MRRSLVLASLMLAIATGAAHAEMSGNVIKLGVMNDMSGLYADIAGQGSVVAAQMAVEDFGGKVGDTPVEIISADHQNKADIGASLARQWYDVEGVDAILDVPTSSVALAVAEVTREKNRVLLNSGAATSDLTAAKCTPNTVHWTYDTWALANGTGRAVVANGGDTWFFITADYAFGHALERDTSAVVQAGGGTVVGTVRAPLNTADFSSFLLQAQASGAKIVGLANAGGDTINSIKQAAEFGIVAGGQKLAGLLIFLSDVHSLGLETAQGLQLTAAFYWDLNDDTRAFAKRFAERHGGRMPTMIQAGVYASTLHYLKAVQALGSDGDGAAVVAKMKDLPTEDALFGKGQVRIDGRTIHDMYLFEVKTPAESTGPWDYYKLVSTIPADKAFRPLAEGGCPLVQP